MPSEERNYYVICDDNCKFPSMTYEQILEAIAEATGNVPEHVEDAFITKVKESNHNANMTFWKGTQAEFNALGVTAPVFKIGIDANGKLYFTPMTADDLTAHASRHASGGEDELTAEDIGALPDYGGTMGGNIDMDGHTVTGLAAPTNDSDAANKYYVDEKTDIIFYAGDGYTGDSEEITTHPADYVYLDTGETLNLDIENYMMEVDIQGYGRVATAANHTLKIELIADNSVIFSQSISNFKDLDSLNMVPFKHYNLKCFFNGGCVMNQQFYSEGTDNIKNMSAISSSNVAGKTVKKVLITGVSSNNTLMNCVVRFTRIKSGG